MTVTKLTFWRWSCIGHRHLRNYHTKYHGLLLKKSQLVKVPIWNHDHILSAFKEKLFMLYSNNNYNNLFKQNYWIFNLDNKLRTNITFDYIAFYLNYLYFCEIGFIEVKSFLISKSEVWNQIYCGIQSTSICFPPHKHVKIVLAFKYRTSYEITMRYSITDPELMISSKQNIYQQYHRKWQKKWNGIFQWIINIPRQRLQFVRLTWSFEKYKYLRITFTHTKYLVWSIWWTRHLVSNAKT